MFGKPEWFKLRANDRGVRPVRLKGWVYLGTWLAVTTLPFLVLIGRGLVPEALIWATVTLGALFWEVKQIRTALRRSRTGEDVLYIGDDEGTSFATANYHLQVKR